MSVLYLDAAAIAERRRVVAPTDGPLAPLADSLAHDLAAVVARSVWIPPEKARLTRAGGTCPRDGARLAFDPYTPRAHRCPVCDLVYDRDEDYAWWTMGYQLWLAERAVHAAALALLRGAPTLGAFAARVLDAQADVYLTYRNVDNVLGPTRPFFSTYLESLWLVHICTALDLLQSAEPGRHDALAGRVLERIVEPSRALITSFPEGTSNRQVWHAVARLAAARLLGDDRGARDAVQGTHGIAALLRTALLPDGSWYEGDNYHQFAHRGFWYALRLARRAGIEIAPDLVTRFQAGYEVPFRVALPDDTLPARRDSQYAVSLRQWRWAEWCELGLAECLTQGDARLGAMLARLYAPADPPLPHRTGRWRATGESERNEPASSLSRADLGWKSLLFARPALPLLAADVTWRSELLPEQGYAVLRRDAGRIYAALDYGGGGGGHGHPDRLNVILQDGAARWLDDPGTGTYVERTLHWYRSTLAHAAPLINGRSQDRGTEGKLSGFDPGAARLGGPPAARPNPTFAFAGVAAHATIRPARVARALLAGDAYVVDLLTWRAEQPCRVDLPFPVDGHVVGRAESWMPFEPGGAGGLEDGFDFVRNAEAMRIRDDPLQLAVSRPSGRAGAGATLWLIAPHSIIWRAVAPGPPGTGERRFHALRLDSDAGAVIAVWDLRATIVSVGMEDADTLRIARTDGSTDRHVAPGVARLDRDGAPYPNRTVSPLRAPGAANVWRVERRDAAGRSATQAVAFGAPPHGRGGEARTATATPSGAERESDRGPPLLLPSDGTPLTFTLGEVHYRRSEEPWRAAGAPRAVVRVSLASPVLTLDVAVQLGRPPAFAPPGAINPLDNERADVNSDGLQLLIDAPATATRAAASWLLVPERPAPALRQTRTSGDTHGPAPTAAWRELADGWGVRCWFSLAGLVDPGEVIALDLAVNERPPGRERRRGQLLLSEPDSPFVYLRGDRMDASRALRFQLPPATPVL